MYCASIAVENFTVNVFVAAVAPERYLCCTYDESRCALVKSVLQAGLHGARRSCTCHAVRGEAVPPSQRGGRPLGALLAGGISRLPPVIVESAGGTRPKFASFRVVPVAAQRFASGAQCYIGVARKIWMLQPTRKLQNQVPFIVGVWVPNGVRGSRPTHTAR